MALPEIGKLESKNSSRDRRMFEMACIATQNEKKKLACSGLNLKLRPR